MKKNYVGAKLIIVYTVEDTVRTSDGYTGDIYTGNNGGSWTDENMKTDN